jgi:hypothetical protein
MHAGQSSATAGCLWRGERVKGQEGCWICLFFCRYQRELVFGEVM